MARKRVNTTKSEIVRCGLSMFLENGYSATSTKMICEVLGLSTGNLTYYFPTKEHLLATLVALLCNFQQETVRQNTEDGYSSLMAICLEIAAMAFMCEEDKIARDLYLSAYRSPMCLELIQENDMRRAKQVFAEFCTDWDEKQFAVAEVLVSGVEYATLMTTGGRIPTEELIAGAVDGVLKIYHVPKELRQAKIQKILALNYRPQSREILNRFKQFVEEANEQALEELIHSRYDSQFTM